MHFKALSVGHQNEQISSDFLHQISKELYRSVSSIEKSHILGKYNKISMKLKTSTDFSEITEFKQSSKESLLPFSFVHYNWIHKRLW